MRALAAFDILRIWDLGQNRPGWQRGLLLLAPCFPDLRPSALAAFSLEKRNRLLLQLHECTLGSSLDALVQCPTCRTPLEFTMTVRELLDEPAAEVTQPGVVDFEGTQLHYRLPDSRDLAAAAEIPELSQATRTLWQRSITHGLPPDSEAQQRALACVEQEIASHYPLTDIRIALRCDSGEHVWAASFDIVSFFWVQLDRVAKQLLDDVQALARGYGWPESSILAMSESRRQFYLGALQS